MPGFLYKPGVTIEILLFLDYYFVMSIEGIVVKSKVCDLKLHESMAKGNYSHVEKNVVSMSKGDNFLIFLKSNGKLLYYSQYEQKTFLSSDYSFIKVVVSGSWIWALEKNGNLHSINGYDFQSAIIDINIINIYTTNIYLVNVNKNNKYVFVSALSHFVRDSDLHTPLKIIQNPIDQNELVFIFQNGIVIVDTNIEANNNIKNEIISLESLIGSHDYIIDVGMFIVDKFGNKDIMCIYSHNNIQYSKCFTIKELKTVISLSSLDLFDDF